MGPSRSFSLCIGDDTSAGAGSGQARDVPVRSTPAGLKMLLRRLPFPWVRVKRK